MANNYGSGKYGEVSVAGAVVAYANAWTMESTADAAQFGTFGGGGTKYGVKGQKSASGTIGGLYDFDDTAEATFGLTAADDVALVLTTNTATGAPASAKTFTFASANLLNFSIEVDGDTGAPVSWSATWQSDGPWTEPT